MQVKQFPDITATRIDNDLAKNIAARVVIGKGDGAENFCMRVFELAEGGFTPKHAHDWEHEIFVHAGEGEIFGNGRWHPFRTGTVLLVPANEEHQIRNRGSETLTFVCLV
ncbi:MAG: cupin domain-containing protein, partial [Desulfuromonadales bacterium]|nr:cupin domain-containing protein [Desulfuromonadales bacterium]